MRTLKITSLVGAIALAILSLCPGCSKEVTPPPTVQLKLEKIEPQPTGSIGLMMNIIAISDGEGDGTVFINYWKAHSTGNPANPYQAPTLENIELEVSLKEGSQVIGILSQVAISEGVTGMDTAIFIPD